MPRPSLVHVVCLVAVLAVGSSCSDSQPAPEQPQQVSSPQTSAPDDAQAPAAPPQLLSREEIRDGWIALFDGHSLFGWKSNTDDARWSIQSTSDEEQAVIVADDPPQEDTNRPGLLLTTARFADYELRCDFRLEKGGNSGVFLRTPVDPQSPAEDCYELNICDTHEEYATGSLVGRKRIDMPVQTDGEWHTFHVRADGPRVTVQLDGREILAYTDDAENPLRTGHVGLQQNEGRIEFRNVFLKPLRTQPVFNGRDLSGWRTVPGSEGQFTVEDGVLHVTGGLGFLETEKTWADFILQAEVRTNAEDVNSGIFFRAQQGTEEAPSNGYELQIHNGFEGGDRTQPNDYGSGFGTGAVFRRRKVRYVVPDDKEWFTMTLLADGPHFATWVDGYPVVDWTDTRAPHENPRRGRRLEAGHLSLQAHDETTDLSVRNLRLAELP